MSGVSLYECAVQACSTMTVPSMSRSGLSSPLERIARPSTDPAPRSAVGIVLTPTGGERCRVPTPPTWASGRSRTTRPARAAGPPRLGGGRGPPVRGREALPDRRAHALGLAQARPRGGAPPSRAAPRRHAAGGRRGREAGRSGRGAERRDARRVRRPAGGPHRGPAQPLGPVPGAEGARPGPEEKTAKAAERDREDVAEARAWRRDELAGVDPGRLVFIDETGIDTRMTRAYARAARGQRATGKVPWGRWERPTVLGALALDGVV